MKFSASHGAALLVPRPIVRVIAPGVLPALPRQALPRSLFGTSYPLNNPEEVECFLEKLTDCMHATELQGNRLGCWGTRGEVATRLALLFTPNLPCRRNLIEPQKEGFSECTLGQQFSEAVFR